MRIRTTPPAHSAMWARWAPMARPKRTPRMLMMAATMPMAMAGQSTAESSSAMEMPTASASSEVATASVISVFPRVGSAGGFSSSRESAADGRQHHKCDPAGVIGEGVGRELAEEIANDRHEELEQTEVEAQPEHMPSRDFGQSHPRRDGNGERVHREAEGNQNDFPTTHEALSCVRRCPSYRQNRCSCKGAFGHKTS